MELKLKSKTHVSFVLPSLAGGGAEKVTLALAKGIANLGFRTELIVFSRKGAFSDSVPPGVAVTNLNASRNSFATIKLAWHLIRNRPKVILSALANVDQSVAIVAPILRIRSFIAIHNTMSQQYSDIANPEVFARMNRVRRLYLRVNGLIGCGKAVAVDADKFLGLPAGSVVPIYNPVVSEELLERCKESVDHPWLSEQLPVIVSVGRLTRQKDYPNLINAFSIVYQQVNCRLIILGEGEDRKELEELIKSLNLEKVVDLPGFCANPYAFISKSQVFVLSSRNEGLPTVLIEALACGTPVVSTNCPSGPEEILKSGLYGRLVPVEDSQSLAAAILETLASPIVPPSESWEPFRSDAVCKQYCSILLGVH